MLVSLTLSPGIAHNLVDNISPVPENPGDDGSSAIEARMYVVEVDRQVPEENGCL